MAELVGIFGVVGVFGSTSYIVYLIIDVIRTRFRVRAATELQAKLIDRLATEDVGSFLSSEHGAEMMRAIAGAPMVAEAGHGRILRALQSGVVLLALGVGMFVYMNAGSPPPFDPEEQFGLGMAATVATALGLGLLVAAAASYALSRRLGLLGRAAE